MGVQVENEYMHDLMAKCKQESMRQENIRRFSSRRPGQAVKKMPRPHCDMLNEYLGNAQPVY